MVNALALVFGEKDYTAFIDYVNTEITHYKREALNQSLPQLPHRAVQQMIAPSQAAVAPALHQVVAQRQVEVHHLQMETEMGIWIKEYSMQLSQMRELHRI